MPPPTNLKTIERLTEVAASLRYVVGSKSEAVFTIQDKGRYRTALALAVVRSLRADRTNEAKWLLGIGREFDPFRLPESVVRGGYSDADLDEHVEELAARIK